MLGAMRYLIAILLLSCWASAQVSDQSLNAPDSGTNFMRVCNAVDSSATTKGICLGYVLGTTDGIKLGVRVEHGIVAATTANEPLFCLPSEVTSGQLLRILVKYIKAHPEQEHWQTPTLILTAAMDSFPCTVKK
jgi:hypothetical protein